jgi:hypothetical protein
MIIPSHPVSSFSQLVPTLSGATVCLVDETDAIPAAAAMSPNPVGTREEQDETG